MNDRSPEHPRSRSTNVEVRKRRRFNQGEATPKVLADPTIGSAEVVSSTAKQTAVSQPKQVVVTLPKEEIAVFTPLDEIPCEPELWQTVGLLKKAGVTVLVAPPGGCSFAMSAYFAFNLSARTFTPFGGARYPGNVLFSTHTPGLARSLRAAASTPFTGSRQIMVQETPRRFDWRLPAANIEGALKNRAPGTTAAVIIDAGPPPSRLDESKIEAGHAVLSALAKQHDCLILLIVEHSSKHPDPFERIPRSLRALRDTLLAVPLRSKALAPQPHAPAEFMLMRLAAATPHALTVRFTLRPVADLVETNSIWWGEITYDNPREAFRTAETIDLSTAERVAVQLAYEVIQQNGPTSSKELQAAGRLRLGIASTTMRDALSVAKLLRHLDTTRSLDGKSYWVIPGVTLIPNWMYMNHALTDRQIPF